MLFVARIVQDITHIFHHSARPEVKLAHTSGLTPKLRISSFFYSLNKDIKNIKNTFLDQANQKADSSEEVVLSQLSQDGVQPSPDAKKQMNFLSQSKEEKKLTMSLIEAKKGRRVHVAQESKKMISPDVNLVPDSFKILPDSIVGDRVRNFFIFLLLILFFNIVLYLGIEYRSQKLRVAVGALEQEIAQVRNEIVIFEKETPTSDMVQQKLKSSFALLEQHSYGSNFLGFLEDVVVSDVFFDDISLDGYQLKMKVGAKTFRDLARQILAFERAEDRITKIEFHQVNFEKIMKDDAEIPLVSTNILLQLRPELFIMKVYAKDQK